VGEGLITDAPKLVGVGPKRPQNFSDVGLRSSSVSRFPMKELS